ncbi:adhesive plaque matrix protein-like [Contarinia nasturtii]|uniref:adhesive plaque matrix protein-like n=1 Tax=Contarinia nasturtii TaxID=265458 RepID=UPI0012D42E3F|nr:adhesive plaque matrix protein-like [Contarinia nasturtii]
MSRWLFYMISIYICVGVFGLPTPDIETNQISREIEHLEKAVDALIKETSESSQSNEATDNSTESNTTEKTPAPAQAQPDQVKSNKETDKKEESTPAPPTKIQKIGMTCYELPMELPPSPSPQYIYYRYPPSSIRPYIPPSCSCGNSHTPHNNRLVAYNRFPLTWRSNNDDKTYSPKPSYSPISNYLYEPSYPYSRGYSYAPRYPYVPSHLYVRRDPYAPSYPYSRNSNNPSYQSMVFRSSALSE